jgi:carotenoid cleavage dioxygenase
MSAPFPDHVFLRDNFAPVLFEADAFDLPVLGQFPDDLNGTLYRNGPNPPFAPRGAHHWFGGQGMIHAFRMRDGRVSYRNRWVATPRYVAERAAGQSLFGGMGMSDPRAAGISNSGGNTNIVTHAGRLFALEEGDHPFELDAETLAPLGFDRGGGKYSACFTAHPKFDPESGEMIAFGYSVGGPLSRQMAYYVIDKNGVVTTSEVFDAPYCSMVHDFIVTKNFVIFPILPLSGSIDRARAGGFPMAWEPELGSYLGVLRRGQSTAHIRWFRGPPCYVFHPMNAWDEGDRIYADVARYPVAPLFPSVDGAPPDPNKALGTLWRWTIDLNSQSDSYKEEQIDDLYSEFPRFDERRSGLAYRHGYYAFNDRITETSTATFTGLAHLDLASGTRQVWRTPKDDLVGEPVFVPKTAQAPEGSGYVLAVIYRGETRTSDLLCFDAGSLADGPFATAILSTRVPFGFHGNFRADTR